MSKAVLGREMFERTIKVINNRAEGYFEEISNGLDDELIRRILAHDTALRSQLATSDAALRVLAEHIAAKGHCEDCNLEDNCGGGAATTHENCIEKITAHAKQKAKEAGE